MIEDPRRQAAQECLATLCDYGVSVVMIVTTEERGACRACQAVVGRMYATTTAPLPPIEGCECECRCEVAPVFLE